VIIPEAYAIFTHDPSPTPAQIDRALTLARQGYLRVEIVRDTKLSAEIVNRIVDALRDRVKPDGRCDRTDDLFGG
jgi:urease alpha subunit